MQSFNDYWKLNLNKYKALAKADFELAIKGAVSQWSAIVSIDEDDDFSLDIGSNFSVEGKDQEDVTRAVIEKLMAAQLTDVKTWAIQDSNGKRSGDYSHAWFSIRDAAVTQLKEGDTSVSYGGNQTINVNIISSENTLGLEGMGL